MHAAWQAASHESTRYKRFSRCYAPCKQNTKNHTGRNFLSSTDVDGTLPVHSDMQPHICSRCRSMTIGLVRCLSPASTKPQGNASTCNPLLNRMRTLAHSCSCTGKSATRA
jgi:hypothetical protein